MKYTEEEIYKMKGILRQMEDYCRGRYEFYESHLPKETYGYGMRPSYLLSNDFFRWRTNMSVYFRFSLEKGFYIEEGGSLICLPDSVREDLISGWPKLKACMERRFKDDFEKVVKQISDYEATEKADRIKFNTTIESFVL